MTVTIEFIDHGVQGEYGFSGKTIARSDVRGMCELEIHAEIQAMRDILGYHVQAIRIEEV